MEKVLSYTKESLEKICKDSYSYAEVLKKFGKKSNGFSYRKLKEKIKEFNIDISHFTGQAWSKGKTKETDDRIIGKKEKYQLEEIFIKDSPVTQKVLRGYIVRHNLLEYKCQNCGCNGKWQGGIIALEVDHINGDNKDNRLENLRYLCPNCHALTDTYCGRNIKIQKKENNNFCIDCGEPISKEAMRCSKCSHKNRRIVERPSKEELKNLIRTTSFVAIAKKFNVSDKAIVKWCVAMNLPSRKSEITKYTDEEWEKI